MSIEFWKKTTVQEGAYGFSFTNPDIIKKLNIQKDTVFLEMGANYGRDTRQLCLMTDNLYTIDINPAYVEGLKKYTPNVFISKTGLKYPFPNEKFDIVYACNVIEHQKKLHLKILLKEISRILKPNGIFCFDTWSGVYEKEDDNYLDKDYVDNGYSKKEMEDLLSPYFIIEYIRPTKDNAAINCLANKNAEVVWYIVKKREE